MCGDHRRAFNINFTITISNNLITVPLSPDSPPTGAAAAYSGMLPTSFPLNGTAQVDVTFTGQVDPALGPPQAVAQNCLPPILTIPVTQAFGMTPLILQNLSVVLYIEQPGVMDSDGDGVPDNQDLCPNSDLSPTVVINGCDSGVSNFLIPFGNGCTLAD